MLLIITAPTTSSSQPNSAVLRCLALQPAIRSTTGADVRPGGGREVGSAPYSSADWRFMGASLGFRPSLKDAVKPSGRARAATSGRRPDSGWGWPHPGSGEQRDE